MAQDDQQSPKLLLFGGSFNPIHRGHIAIAQFALHELHFARVIFVPNGDNYHKPGLAPAIERLKMVQAAVAEADEPAFEVLDVEAFSDKALRVVQTAREVREAYPAHEIHLLRGVDSLPKTHRDYFKIPQFRVLVLDRDEAGRVAYEAILQKKAHLAAHRSQIDFVPGLFRNDISSTQIREAIAASKSIDSLVPLSVAQLIKQRGLYLPSQ